jgi:cyanate lyase
MMLPVEVLAEKFEKGILVAIEYEWDMTKHFSEKDADIASVQD